MQAWHKEQKAKAIKKSKAVQQKEKTEKLARRNPDRLQRQVDELKEAIEAGHASAHNKKQLADLERDLAAVRKARKATGIEDKEPPRAGAQKRAREEEPDWREKRRDARMGKKEEMGEESDSGGSQPERSAHGRTRLIVGRRIDGVICRGYSTTPGPTTAATR
jgi:hypothetical protein